MSPFYISEHNTRFEINELYCVMFSLMYISTKFYLCPVTSLSRDDDCRLKA